MNHSRTFGLTMALALAAAGAWSSPARAQAVPRALRGHIITNQQSIDIPTSNRGFVKKLKKQDRNTFKKDAEGKWVLHFVAFFKRGLPTDSMGVVVLDAKQEPVAVAEVGGKKGQWTLASRIVVDTTETPGKKHTLQVYYPRGNKPVVLAKKKILLK